MQLSSLNNVNFSGKVSNFRPRDNKDEVIEGTWREVASQEDKNPRPTKSEMDVTDKIAKLAEVIEKAAKDVKPITIILTMAVAIFTATKGRKIIPIARKAIATMGEVVADGAISAFKGIAKLFKKDINADKAKESVGKFADKLRNMSKNEEFMQSAKKLATNIVGEEKAKKFTEFLSRNKIESKAQLFDATAAAAVALCTIDKTSDETEKHADEIAIKNAKKKLFGDGSIELADIIELVSTGIGAA